MEKKRVLIVMIIWIFLIFITFIIGNFYFQYNSLDQSQDGYSINDIDEDKLHSRPYTYINSLSEQEISSVKDLYKPKFFNYNNISVYFPEGEKYAYCIGLMSEYPYGTFGIYYGNGSELDFSKWVSSGKYGGSIYSELVGFGGGDNLTLTFKGQGIIVFLSASTSEIFEIPPDYSGSVDNDLTSFIIPFNLTMNKPLNRRITSRIIPTNEIPYNVRFYSETLRFLGEVKGTNSKQIDLPSGQSFIVIAVFESEGDTSLRFGYSDTYQDEGDSLGFCLFGGFVISILLLIILSFKTLKMMVKKKNNVNKSNDRRDRR